MKELTEYVVKHIVASPESVKVTEVEDADRIIIRLEVAPEDKGKVIGREGKVAQAIRSLLRIGSIKNGTKTVLEIV